MPSTPTDAAALPSCPYPGLRPFRADEAVVFFGRDEQVDELLERLGRQRFGRGGDVGLREVVAGPCRADSSSGDRLFGLGRGTVGCRHDAARRPASLATCPGAARPGGARPGLVRPRAPRRSASTPTLQRGPLGLVEVLGEAPLSGRRKLLLLVDQFEEIFRYRRDEGERPARRRANAFVSLLLATPAQTDLPSLRRPDDAVRLPRRLRALRRAARGPQRQPVPDPEAHPRPAAAGHRGAGPGLRGPGRARLVTRMLNDMGSGPDQLPLCSTP